MARQTPGTYIGDIHHGYASPRNCGPATILAPPMSPNRQIFSRSRRCRNDEGYPSKGLNRGVCVRLHTAIPSGRQTSETSSTGTCSLCLMRWTPWRATTWLCSSRDSGTINSKAVCCGTASFTSIAERTIACSCSNPAQSRLLVYLREEEALTLVLIRTGGHDDVLS